MFQILNTPYFNTLINLFVAVSCGHLPIVEILINNGVNASIKNDDGELASELYEKEFDPKIIDLLES